MFSICFYSLIYLVPSVFVSICCWYLLLNRLVVIVLCQFFEKRLFVLFLVYRGCFYWASRCFFLRKNSMDCVCFIFCFFLVFLRPLFWCVLSFCFLGWLCFGLLCAGRRAPAFFCLWRRGWWYSSVCSVFSLSVLVVF